MQSQAGADKTCPLLKTNMFGKRFETELQMIKTALRSEKGESTLRVHLLPFVNSVVEQYLAEHNLGNISVPTLEEVAWRYFRVAVRRYAERAALMLQGKNDVYYFESYFRWFIRQAIAEYLLELSASCEPKN